VTTERAADRVISTRLMPDVPPPPFHKFAGGFRGNVDRWMKVEAIVPCYVDVDVGSADARADAFEGPREGAAVAYHALNLPTPETETTTHFFYGHARLFHTASAEMDEVYRRDFLRIFMEDVTIVEAQQAALDRGARPWIDINVDAPGIAMRNLLRDRIAAEARG
jgi:vanillate O-demethylase monooxygenase subunit